MEPSQQVPSTQRCICPSTLETRLTWAKMTMHQAGRISLMRLALALAADLASPGQPSISRDGTTGHCPLPRESQHHNDVDSVVGFTPPSHPSPMLVPAQRDRRAWRPRKDPLSRRHISDLAEPSRSSDAVRPDDRLESHQAEWSSTTEKKITAVARDERLPKDGIKPS